VVPDKLPPPPNKKKPAGDKDEPANAPPAGPPPPKDVKPKPAPAPEKKEPPADPGGGRKLVAIRQKMIEVAKAEVGQVDDRGGEGGKRKGWEHLKDYLEKALSIDAEKQGWLPAIQTPGKRAGGLHWCGIFGVWCAITCGLDVKWHAPAACTGAASSASGAPSLAGSTSSGSSAADPRGWESSAPTANTLPATSWSAKGSSITTACSRPLPAASSRR
jgi:hypothetical protein